MTDDAVTTLDDVTREGDVMMDVMGVNAGGALGTDEFDASVVMGFVGEGEAGLAIDIFAIWSANERRGVRHWVHRTAFGKLR